MRRRKFNKYLGASIGIIPLNTDSTVGFEIGQKTTDKKPTVDSQEAVDYLKQNIIEIEDEALEGNVLQVVENPKWGEAVVSCRNCIPPRILQNADRDEDVEIRGILSLAEITDCDAEMQLTLGYNPHQNED